MSEVDSKSRLFRLAVQRGRQDRRCVVCKGPAPCQLHQCCRECHGGTMCDPDANNFGTAYPEPRQ
jgi:hypothetical protein